ncbi:hypothetical protein [uncultured Microbacterium sp.]|nr:hypothetical protein [uncultured Microbacterium sp.]
MSAKTKDADEDYSDFERRNRRLRTIAWVTIIALIVGGGGATLFTLVAGG